MNHTHRLETFAQLKTLSDARRMQVLRLLMAAPSTLTQLAGTLGQSPAWVRHHLLALESAGLVELAEVRTTGTVTEKFYRSKASAWLLQEIILPQGDKPVILFSGSHDLAIERLAEQLAPHVVVITQPVGSLDGLVYLRQGLCHLAGSHLQDSSGEYNTPFIRHFFPDREISLVTLAHREQGLLVAPGNPKHIRSLSDLGRGDVIFVNRQPGSGTRAWLDGQLKRIGLAAGQVNGYSRQVWTHDEAAAVIQRREADTAVGLHAVARLSGLDFIPLFHERFDLVFPSGQAGFLHPLLDHIQGIAFRREVGSLEGYDIAHTGERIQ